MSKKRKIIIIGIVAILLIALSWTVLALIEERGLKDIQFGDTGGWSDEDDETYLTIGDADYMTADDIDTYLLIGTDNGGEVYGKAYSGEFADFLLLIIVDNTTKSYGLYSIDRNTIVPVSVLDENGDFAKYQDQQICIAHWYGLDAEQRNQNTASAVSSLLGGLDIDSYYTMSMSDIGKINHAVGGVEVTIDEDLTRADPEFAAGRTILLSDEQAEKYLRARFVLDDASNASRMRRQQQYMQNVYDKLFGQLKDNPEYINEVYGELKSSIQTDGSAGELSTLVNHMIQYEGKGFIKFDGETKLNDTLGDGVEHEEFHIASDSIVSSLKMVMDLKEDDESE